MADQYTAEAALALAGAMATASAQLTQASVRSIGHRLDVLNRATEAYDHYIMAWHEHDRRQGEGVDHG